jgi:glutathionylspermidine synthase
MQRIATSPRPEWPRLVESQGMHFHTLDGQPYWDEGAFYLFSPSQIEEIERATYALDALCLEAVQHVLDHDLLHLFHVPDRYHDFVRRSWETDERTIYGRFDLAYRGAGPPKLLEYNADTPTALLEAAVVQWFWLQDCHPDADQFNSLHERLIEAWQALAAESPGRVTFASLAGHVEDYMTANYLRDTAMQAGLDTRYLPIEEIGWHAGRRVFTDRDERPLSTVFKLYPWEWMLRDEFAPHLLDAPTRWLEPPWKMLLSNKAILVVLWELFPNNPYLLPASFEPLDAPHVRKPLCGREGANVALVDGGEVLLEAEGPYADEPCVYQEMAPLKSLDGNYPILGSWMVNGYACGLGVREDRQPITQNTSRFVPHLLRP